jgi:hypothetical protein
MTDLIITSPIRIKQLIENLQEEFNPDDIVTTGLWIRKVDTKQG